MISACLYYERSAWWLVGPKDGKHTPLFLWPKCSFPLRRQQLSSVPLLDPGPVDHRLQLVFVRTMGGE